MSVCRTASSPGARFGLLSSFDFLSPGIAPSSPEWHQSISLSFHLCPTFTFSSREEYNFYSGGSERTYTIIDLLLLTPESEMHQHHSIPKDSLCEGHAVWRCFSKRFHSSFFSTHKESEGVKGRTCTRKQQKDLWEGITRIRAKDCMRSQSASMYSPVCVCVWDRVWLYDDCYPACDVHSPFLRVHTQTDR